VTAGIPAVVKEVTPSTTVYYYREPGGELLARQEGSTGSTRRYYHFDGLGSTSLLTNTNGDWTDKYSHDGWGNGQQHGTDTGAINQPYQYVVQKTLDGMASGNLNVDALVTHRFPLERVREAFDLVAAYDDGVIKAMIDISPDA